MIRHQGYGESLYADIMAACVRYHWAETDKVKAQYTIGAMFVTWCYTGITPHDYADWYANNRADVWRLIGCGISVPEYI